MKITYKLIDEFVQFYTNRNFKPKTVRRLELTFYKFFDFFQKQGKTKVEEITTKIIEEYTEFIANQPVPKQSIYYGKNKKISGRTIQEKVQSVKNFLKFCNYIYDVGLDYERIEVPKYKSQRMDYLNNKEIFDLLSAVDKSEKYKINKIRGELIVLLGYTSGMRLAELLSLKVSQLEGTSTVITGKGDKTRVVFISEGVRKLLKEYLELRKQPLPRTGQIAKNTANDEYVFISHNPCNFGCPVCKPTVCRWFQKYNKELGLKDKKVSCHVLRHSCATSLLENDVNLYEIKNILGHSSLRTTQIYLHIKNKKLQNTHDKVFGDISY